MSLSFQRDEDGHTDTFQCAPQLLASIRLECYDKADSRLDMAGESG